jgi:Spy/CpxP family protein refolding chaperone
MNRALQWKLIAGFILVFIAGGMTGAFIAASHSRHMFIVSHRPELMAQRMRERLRHELKLTPEQLAKISPIIDKSTTQLEEIRMETGRRVHETFVQAHREMAANLTEEQRAKLQQLEARHRQWHGMHGSHPPPEGPPP